MYHYANTADVNTIAASSEGLLSIPCCLLGYSYCRHCRTLAHMLYHITHVMSMILMPV